MHDDNRLLDLLEKWEEAKNRGQSLSPEELCSECPELLSLVKARIESLHKIAWLNRPLNPPGIPDKASQLENNGEGTHGHGFSAGTFLGRYRLNRLIGKGGFGQVWEANDPQLNRTVAIKIPHPERLVVAETIDHFIQEARRTARLVHPGIVPVFDAGQQGGVVYLVTQYIPGGSLADHEKKKSEPLEINLAIKIALALAEALQHAHEQGIIHGDLKPTNILMEHPEKPKLADFGIAASLDIENGQVNNPIRTLVIGTPAYLAPELLSGKATAPTVQGDIYSLGVVFYQLLTGNLPRHFDPKTHFMLEPERLVPPKTYRPELSWKIEKICLKALAPNPQDRFASAKDFADALRGLTAPRRKSGWYIIAMVLVISPLFYFVWSDTTRSSTNADASKIGPSRQGDNKRIIVDATHVPIISPSKKLVGHLAHVTALQFLDAKNLLSAGYDGSIRTWNIESGGQIHSVEGATDQCTHSVVVDANKMLAYCGNLVDHDHTEVVERDLISGQCRRHFKASLGKARCILLLSDDAGMLACAGDGTVAVWDLRNGQLCFETKTPADPRAFLFGPDNRSLIVGQREGQVLVYGLPDGVLKLQNSPSASVRAFAWLGDGSKFVSVGNLGYWCLYAMHDGVVMTKKVQAKDNETRQFCIVPLDRQHMAIGYQTGEIWIWNFQTLQVVRKLLGHKATVFSLAVSPDGRTLASGDETANLYLWKIPRGVNTSH